MWDVGRPSVLVIVRRGLAVRDHELSRVQEVEW